MAARNPSVYSRWVGILKIVLPLIAICLLATVFLIRKVDTFEGGLVFTKIDMATLGDGLTIRNPRFSGITDGGDTFTLRAARAVPDGAKAKRIDLADVSADFTFENGVAVEAAAAHGLAEIPEQMLTVEGGLTGVSSRDYKFQTDGGQYDMRSGYFVSTGPVTIDGPDQHLEAGLLRIDVAKNGSGRIFYFENGVKLTYYPQATQN